MTWWRKSSYSGSQSQNCVECACLQVGRDGIVGIRDSADPDGPHLILSQGAWGALLVQLEGDG